MAMANLAIVFGPTLVNSHPELLNTFSLLLLNLLYRLKFPMASFQPSHSSFSAAPPVFSCSSFFTSSWSFYRLIIHLPWVLLHLLLPPSTPSGSLTTYTWFLSPLPICALPRCGRLPTWPPPTWPSTWCSRWILLSSLYLFLSHLQISPFPSRTWLWSHWSATYKPSCDHQPSSSLVITNLQALLWLPTYKLSCDHQPTSLFMTTNLQVFLWSPTYQSSYDHQSTSSLVITAL